MNRREFLRSSVALGVTATLNPLEIVASLERLARPFWYGMATGGLNARPVPDYLQSKPVGGVRRGAILRLETKIIEGTDGLLWHKIIPDRYLRFSPQTEEYVWAGGVREIVDDSPIHPWVDPSDKKIVIKLGEQRMIAYEKGTKIMETLVTTGKKRYETPTGEFWIRYKRWSRQMQGPGYNLRGVPFCWYFTEAYAGHGAWWRSDYGPQANHQENGSHGCVNVPLVDREDLGMSVAEWLYRWTDPQASLNAAEYVIGWPQRPATKVIIEK